jgi:ParB-like chromosome segregation protein Spo0J
MEIVRLTTADLVSNTGQIDGVPTNPRQWTKGDVEKIGKSLKDTPELFDMRPCLVYEVGGKYVVLGGNLRLEGAKKNGWKEVPAIIVPHGTSTEKLKEIVIKDNGAFGAWDFDALANEWDDLPLTEWGVPAWNIDEDEEAYTKKIEIPTYEPSEEGAPEIEALVDKAKYNALCADIDAADIPKEVADFLKVAATRHIVFDYEKIGDYYASADAAVQKLMEDSALVIIDVGGAIENGFVKMTEELEAIYNDEHAKKN